jgi:hypothetical protein
MECLEIILSEILFGNLNRRDNFIKGRIDRKVCFINHTVHDVRVNRILDEA